MDPHTARKLAEITFRRDVLRELADVLLSALVIQCTRDDFIPVHTVSTRATG